MDSSRDYRLGSLALICVATAWHAWVASQVVWLPDDWIYLVRVNTYSFTDYVLQDYNGHAMPLQFAFLWLLTTLFPMSFAAQAVVIAASTAAGIAAWSAAFAEIFGPRLRLLLPLSVIALTPISLYSAGFWASAIQLFPLQAFVGMAVLYAARAARGVPGALWRLLLTYALALLWWEKSLLMVLPVAAVVLLCGSGRLRDLLRTLAPVGVVTAAYLPGYLWVRGRVDEQLPSWVNYPDSLTERAVQYFQHSWSVLPDLVVPAMVGGPWGTVPVLGDFYRRPDRPLMLVLTAIMVVALVVAVRLRGRRAWLPLALAVVYVVIAGILIMFSTKYQLLGPHALYEDRYFPDVLAVLMLCVAMLLSPLRGEPESPRTVSAVQRVGADRVRALGVGAAAVLLTSLGVSNAQLWAQIAPVGDPSQDWVRTVAGQLDSAGGAGVVDALPPNDVLESALWADGFTVSKMFASRDTGTRFGGPGMPMQTFDSDWNLQPAVVAEAIVAEPGPQPECGYFLAAGDEVEVSMSASLFEYIWGVELALFSGSGGQLSVTIDGDTQQVAVPSGLSSPQFLHSGAISEISVRIDGPEASACLAGAHAGEISAGVG
jgi:hypothetical protein